MTFNLAAWNLWSNRCAIEMEIEIVWKGSLVAALFIHDIESSKSVDFRCLFEKNKALFSDFVRLSLPALGNYISRSVAFSMYAVIIGHMGTDAVAANSFVVVVRNFGTILCFGMASAGGILLGNIIGENKLEEAREGAGKLMKLPVMWVYFLLRTDEFVKWPWVISHYRSGKWLNNITRDDLFMEKGKAG